MLNHFTIINKMNGHLSLSLTEKTIKRDHDIWRCNPGPDLVQAHKCGEVKPDNGIPILPSW